MNKRIDFFKYVVYGLFLVIMFRVFYLQVVNRDYYNSILNSKLTRNISLQSPRGRIYDSKGNLLVDNQLQRTILYKRVSGMTTKEEISFAYRVSEYLDLDYSKLTKSYLKDFYLLTHEEEISNKITDKEYRDYKNRLITANEFYQLKKNKVLDIDLDIYDDKDLKAIYLYYLMNNGYNYEDKVIKENSSIEEFMFFAENSGNLDGFSTQYTYVREYLYDDTLKSVLGRVGYIPSENSDFYLNKGYNLSDKVGLSSIELIYDDYLRGENELYRLIDGEKYLIKDGEQGNDLVLTININLQKYIEEILSQEIINAKRQSSAKYFNHSYVVVSDTKGRVLAMVGKEYFNGKIIDRSVGTITDTMTPGSSVKAASMLIGYDTKTIGIGEVLVDECLKIKNTPKKCSFSSMGRINDIQALSRSSNVYQFKIAIKLGGGVYQYNQSLKINDEAFNTYREYFSRFGLGESTGIELLNESKGYKGTSKLPGLLLDFAIGQYDTYTTMQLNQYISTIAQNGDRYRMHLLDKVLNNNQIVLEKEPEVLNNINIPSKYLERVTLGLRSVITSGTGYGYVNTRYKPAGKTGTSESFMDTNGDGVIDKETNSTSFVMFMPYDDPQIAISMTSPNISYTNAYNYPINKRVIRKVTDNIYKFL